MAQGPGPDRRRIFADPAGEDERVDTVEAGAETQNRLGQTIAEDVHGEIGAGVSLTDRLHQGAHVVADTGDPKQAALAVQNVRDPLKIVIDASGEIVVKVRIDVAAARSHHEALQRGQAHRGIDAMAFPDRAGAAPVTEMSRHQVQLLEGLVQDLGRLTGHDIDGWFHGIRSVLPGGLRRSDTEWHKGTPAEASFDEMLCRRPPREGRRENAAWQLGCRSNGPDCASGASSLHSSIPRITSALDFNAVLERLSSVNHTVTDSDNFEVANLAQNFIENVDMLGVRQLDLVVYPLDKLRFQAGLRACSGVRQAPEFEPSRCRGR